MIMSVGEVNKRIIMAFIYLKYISTVGVKKALGEPEPHCLVVSINSNRSAGETRTKI